MMADNLTVAEQIVADLAKNSVPVDYYYDGDDFCALDTCQAHGAAAAFDTLHNGVMDWHYLADNDLPDKQTEVWVLIEDDMGRRHVRRAYCTRASGIWRIIEQSIDEKLSVFLNVNERVIAWQPMVPPAPPVADITPEQVAAYLEGIGGVRVNADEESVYWEVCGERICQPIGADNKYYSQHVMNIALLLYYYGMLTRAADLILADMARMPKEG